MQTQRLKTLINQLWDKFWSSGIATRESVILQVGYLIFIKWLENTGHTADPIMKWTYIRQMTDKKAMLDHVAATVFPWLKTLPPADFPFSAQMANATFLIPHPLLLEEAMQLLDSIDTELGSQSEGTAATQETLGDVYDYLVHDMNPTTDLVSRTTLPAHLSLLMGELAQPTINDVVLDPACGPGDLLVVASQLILTAHTSPAFQHTDDNGFQKGSRGDTMYPEVWTRFKRQTFAGIEKDEVMLQIATMNLMLHGVDRPLMVREDTQQSADNKKKPTGYTLIITNLLTNKLELIPQLTNLLTPGGRAVILVPQSFITCVSGQQADWKKALVQSESLEAIINLPPTRVQPSGPENGSILVLKRKKSPDRKNQPAEKAKPQKVWFARMLSDGYSYTPDGEPIKLPPNPLPLLVTQFHQRHTKKASPATTPDIEAGFVTIDRMAGDGLDWGADQYKQSKQAPTPQPGAAKLVTEALTQTAIGKILGGALADALSVLFKSPLGTNLTTNVMQALSRLGFPEAVDPVTVTHAFIKVSYANNPFTFRQLQADFTKLNPSMTYDRLHTEVWEMLRASDPLLRQAYFDSRMATTYPAAYQYLRDNKSENGIYLLYLGETEKIIENEAAVL